ncbi:MAG: cation-transporting P-type ATPase, partial [Clostridia bacterium]|nr:cation-transporting P-type ATPase [Clostridia bacterium]
MQQPMELWHTLSVDEVEARLKTNVQEGLSPKIARRRLERFGRNELFLPEPRSLKTCILRILSDTSLLVLAFICLIALFFGRFATSLTVLFVLAVSCTVSGAAYLKTNRIKEAMSSYSAPRVRVLRGGQVLLCDAASVVPGDVLLLREGDVVPCDARLVSSSSDFCVLTYVCDERGKVSYYPSPKDASVVYDRQDAEAALERANMVFAAAVVHQGEARAIVTETGEATLIGSEQGPHPLAMPVGDPGYLTPMRKYMNRYSLIMCDLILPVTIIGIFAGKGSVDLLDVFLLTLSLVVSSMSEQLLMMGRIVCA